MEKVKTLIIGSGPAGYTAAIYAGRAGLNPVLYSGMQPGGQLTITTEVENFPGYPNGVDGTQMMMDMKEQAARFGADLRDGSISKVDFSSRPYHLTDERGNEIEADTVIIATGASAKYLGLADEEKYRGQGVSACATCDGFFYRKRTVAVVGGGDTACEEAMYLSGLAKKVYMIVRKPYLRASEIMQKRVKEKENIEILFETNTLGLFGENGVEGAHLVRHMGEANEEKFDIAIDGFFLAIGHKPNTDLFKDFIDLDEQGFIKVVPGTASTNLPGIFAAGDVADPVYRQGIVAAGSGAKADILDQFLDEKEGNHTTAYRDGSGIWTICRGATMVDGKPVIPGMKLSKEKCDQVNAIERDKALAWVERNIKVPLTEPQKAGIASFCPYNIGPGKCFPSTFYKRLNAGDRKGACEAIRWWIKDGGRDCRIRSNNCYGQVIRRDQESALTCWGIEQ